MSEQRPPDEPLERPVPEQPFGDPVPTEPPPDPLEDPVVPDPDRPRREAADGQYIGLKSSLLSQKEVS